MSEEEVRSWGRMDELFVLFPSPSSSSFSLFASFLFFGSFNINFWFCNLIIYSFFFFYFLHQNNNQLIPINQSLPTHTLSILLIHHNILLNLFLTLLPIHNQTSNKEHKKNTNDCEDTNNPINAEGFVVSCCHSL